MEYTVSDHKPVSSIFTLQVRHLPVFFVILFCKWCKPFWQFLIFFMLLVCDEDICVLLQVYVFNSYACVQYDCI